MKNLYTENGKIFNFAAVTISFVDVIYMLVFYMTSQNPWLSIVGVILFPLVNVPAVKLSVKKNRNIIDYTLTLTLLSLLFVIIVSGVNSPGWLPAFSLLTAIEIMVINKRYKTFLQLSVLTILFTANVYLGRNIESSIIIVVVLIVFILLLSTIMRYILDINRKVQEAKNELDIAHKHVRESIEYASLIQEALIPDNDVFKEYFSDYFTYWKPKDVVGGDIYLFDELRNKDECLLMVIDCTGHGVPGAFVTMLVKAIERQITARINYSDEIVEPAKYLAIFNTTMKQLLHQEDADSTSNAGFDGAILYYNKKEKIIRFAGAETSLYHVKDGELKTINGNRYSVGYKKCDMNYEYKEHTIEVEDGMSFYLTTDGYLDQNGGEKGFPFGKKRFKALIEQNQEKSMQTQEKLFIDALLKYQNNEERNDDVTLVGIKI